MLDNNNLILCIIYFIYKDSPAINPTINEKIQLNVAGSMYAKVFDGKRYNKTMQAYIYLNSM